MRCAFQNIPKLGNKVRRRVLGWDRRNTSSNPILPGEEPSFYENYLRNSEPDKVKSTAKTLANQWTQTIQRYRK